MVRAKFVCRSIRNYGAHVDLELVAVYDGSKENESFWKATPAGSIMLSVVNQEAAAQFYPGVYYYVDFTEAPEQ